jgi:hypothetical protein
MRSLLENEPPPFYHQELRLNRANLFLPDIKQILINTSMDDNEKKKKKKKLPKKNSKKKMQNKMKKKKKD